MIGPDFEFKVFKASAHHVKQDRIKIFTSDNLEVIITVEFQYFLIKEDLKLLHDTYNLNYDESITKTAVDAIKNAITKFDTDEFIANRSVIQKELLTGVRQRLSGKCCLPNCKINCDTCKEWEKCDTDCKPRSTCTNNDKGVFVEVRYLQLQDIDIPTQVNERRLLALIRDLEKEKEESIKQEMIVRKQTEFEVNAIKNNASFVIANADAQAKFITSESHINYEKSIDMAHTNGSKIIIDGLGLVSMKHKASLNYLNALKDHEKVKYSIDFNTIVASSNKK